MSSAQRPSSWPPPAVPEVRPDAERVAGRYTLERLLGEGGTAAVYVALDALDGRRVALKRLLPDAPTRARTLFEREYEVLVSLRHPSIVEAFDYGHDGDSVYYTMALIDGVDLRKQAPLPWRTVCAHLRDVASILGLLHARRLLHRDLSPRNLLCTSDGGLKLIDFGAVAPFGVNPDIVGTPPFVPPEALTRGELDQRYDLFALGALGYFLITGTHAYPARSLQDLSRLWQRAPELASARVAARVELGLPAVPRELDELLEALLRSDRSERPDNTTDLIDRLQAIADLAPEAEGEAARGYLDSKAFVGRERERQRVREALQGARDGRGQALLVEGRPGFGRTRLLAQAATIARLEGAFALTLEPTPRERPHAAVRAAFRLALATASETAREALTAARPAMDGTAAEAEPPLEAILRVLADERTVLLVMDDFHLRDQESQAVFVRLAHALRDRPVVLLAGAESGTRSAPSAALMGLRAASVRVHLAPLSAREIHELLRSVFGSAPYLERLATRLYRTSEGHPAYCLELARHLVQRGAIRYEEGAWILPAELGADDLPATRAAGHRVWLDRLSPDARAFARRLSIPHWGECSEVASAAVADRLGVELPAVLSELTREGVLRPSPEGHRFAHPDLQAALAEELTGADAAETHRDMADALARQDLTQTEACLRVALHCLRGGRPERAYPLIKHAAGALVYADVINARELRATSLEFAEIDALLAARGDDDHARVEPLSMLALSGYFDDKRYAVRYGDQAVATLARLLRLPLARRLSRVLGRKLGLIGTLAVAGARLFLQRRRGPTLVTAIRRLMQVCSALSGTAACCIDPLRIAQLGRTVEPFTALGDRHAAGVTYRFIEALRFTVEDCPARANEALRSLIELLDSDTRIRELEPPVREQLLAGCLFALGVNESLREGEEVLRIADRLDAFGPLYQMSADHLRGAYHARHGDMSSFERYRQQVELHAVYLGTSWQVETWAAENSIPRALRLFDAMLLKRALQELTRLSQQTPSLERAARHSRGSYLVLRGRHAEAIRYLDDDEAPAQYIGWCGYRGTFARALNSLGDHARAREVCRATLAHLGPADLDYVVLSLWIQLEDAVADAGLGDAAAAQAKFDALFARFSPHGNRVTLVSLHEGRFRACLLLGDFERARQEHTRLSQHCRQLSIPTLVQLATSLGRELHRAQYPKRRVTGIVARLPDQDTPLVTRAAGTVSTASDAGVAERALRALQLALERSGADEGFVALSERAGGGQVHLGSEPPSRELLAWAKEQMALTIDPRTLTVATNPLDSQLDSNYRVVGRIHYCVAVLTGQGDDLDEAVGALVLGFDGRVPELPDPEVLARIADWLSQG